MSERRSNDSPAPESDTKSLRDPDIKPASHDQSAKAQGVYANLLKVEAQCIDVDKKLQASAREKDPKRTRLEVD